MVLEDEKVAENRKLRRLEALRHANLLTFPSSYFLIFQNICVYSCSSVVSLILFPTIWNRKVNMN